MPAPAQTGVLPVSGGTLYYEVSGKGAPIVFIHAAIADRRMWNREFDQYAKERTTVRYDIRGLGRSPPATAEYSDVDDLRALLDHLHLRSATLVGCSNGGRLAIDFALENPNRVNALLLVSPGLSGFTAELAPDGQSTFDADSARSAKIPGDWNAGRHDEALEGLCAYWTSAQTGANLDLVRTMMRENAAEIFTDASAGHNRGIKPPAAGRLGSIAVPTTVLLGDRDEPSMSYIVRTIVRGIPGAQLVPVPGGDHLVNLSRPQEFDRSLHELLQKVGSKPAGSG
jgi:3-oxoadipate enol-lactonase